MLKLARQLAELSEKHPRVGCVLARKKKVLGLSCNLYKSHPTQKGLNYYRFFDEKFDECKHELHAEVAAILRVKDKSKLEGATIYICRIDKNGNDVEGYPCKACFELIKRYKIKKIVCS